jgi:hypothetical protein
METMYYVTNRQILPNAQRPWFGTEPSKSLSDLRIGHIDLDLDKNPPDLRNFVVASESRKQDAGAPAG